MIPLPQDEPGKGKALLLTALVHLGLIGALFLGVQWKQNQNTAVEVEIWADRPQVATAPPPAPEPPPPEPPKPEPKPEPKSEPKPLPKPDIAVKDKTPPKPPKEEPKKQPPPPPPKETKPRLPSVDDELKQLKSSTSRSTQAAQLAAEAESEQRAAGRSRGLADYAAKIRAKVKGNIYQLPSFQGNPEAIFEVNQLPDGTILPPIKLKKTSGNAALDTTIERAILKSSPLPKPADPSLFQRVLELKYRPLDE